MGSGMVISIILVCCFLWVSYTLPVALSCDSCGRECAQACGTRHFRTCCFNYLRKRSSPFIMPPPPGLKLELWLEKSQIERAARNALIEGSDKLQQDLIDQHHKFNHIAQQLTQPLALQQQQIHNPLADDQISNQMDQQNEGGRLQLIYDA